MQHTLPYTAAWWTPAEERAREKASRHCFEEAARRARATGAEALREHPWNEAGVFEAQCPDLPEPPDVAPALDLAPDTKTALPTRDRILEGFEKAKERCHRIIAEHEEWKRDPQVRKKYLEKWRRETEQHCRLEIAKDRSKLARERARARRQAACMRAGVAALKAQLESANQGVRLLERQVQRWAWKLQQNEEQEREHGRTDADPDEQRKAMTIAKAEYFEELRLEHLKQRIKSFRRKGMHSTAKKLEDILRAGPNPGLLEDSKKAAEEEMRREGVWKTTTPLQPVKSEARAALEMQLNKIAHSVRLDLWSV